MTETELKTLIRQAIADLLAPRPRRALVVFTGGLLGFEDALDSLRRLASTGVTLEYVQTPSARHVLDQDAIKGLGLAEAAPHAYGRNTMLIAPTLTSNIAAKVAHGVADCLASNLISDFIMNNRLVVASRTPVCPDGAAKRALFPQMPPAYADLLRGNLTALASFGVHLCNAGTLCRTAIAAWEARDRADRGPLLAALGTSAEGLSAARTLSQGNPHTAHEPVAAPPTSAPAAPRSPSPVTAVPASVVVCDLGLISQQEIRQLEPGVELRVPASAKVTPLARDLASQRSIRISREA